MSNDYKRKVAHIGTDSEVELRKKAGLPIFGLCGERIEGIDATDIPVERCNACARIFEQITGYDPSALERGGIAREMKP